MLTFVEVRQIKSQNDLDHYLDKFMEVLKFGGVLTVSWQKTQYDIYKETFKENKDLQTLSKYQTLTKLSENTKQYPELQINILFVLTKYHIIKQNYLEALQYLEQLMNLQLKYPDRHQYLEMLNKIRNLQNQLNPQSIWRLAKLLHNENILQKDEFLDFYDKNKVTILQDSEINIKFLEELSKYLSQDINSQFKLFTEYINQNLIEKAQKLYLKQFPNQDVQQISILEMKNTFNNKINEKTQKQDQINNLQTQIDLLKSTGNTQANQLQQIYEQILKLKSEIQSNSMDQAQTQLQFAQLLKIDKKYDLAIEALQKGLYELKKEKLINYSQKLLFFESQLYDQLGDCYKLQNKLQDALFSFQDSLELKEESKENNYKQILFTKMQLASTYSKLNNLDKALEIFQQILHIQEQQNFERPIIGSTQNNIASILLSLGQLDIALKFSEQAIDNMSLYPEYSEALKKVIELKSKIEKQISKSCN